MVRASIRCLQDPGFWDSEELNVSYSPKLRAGAVTWECWASSQLPLKRRGTESCSGNVYRCQIYTPQTWVLGFVLGSSCCNQASAGLNWNSTSKVQEDHYKQISFYSPEKKT